MEWTYSSSTASVLVLMPPAVEPGLPPMNIRMAERNLLPSVRAAVSTLLNPAVLGVTALKKQARNFWEPFIPTRMLSRSIR